ncbi:MAG: rhodanese-like domain-containing protein [Campylobacterota bacterium]|nr:rhodanese-like domain-containing protein [Campylobacterota bacterium]
MKKLFLGLSLLVSISYAKFQTIDSNQLLKMQKDGVVVIDIRTPQEWKDTGIIKGSKTIEFFNEKGGVDFISFMKDFTKYVKNSEQSFIIYCAHANRTKTIGNLFTQLGIPNVYHLKGGINYGWRDLGKKTVSYKKEK